MAIGTETRAAGSEQLNAHNQTCSSEMNATDPSLGFFPERRNAVQAGVLSRLITGEVMTDVNAVSDASTTHHQPAAAFARPVPRRVNRTP